jgi:YbbR domain-containing protein
MNKRFDHFFEKDLVLKIISVLIGIMLWFIVLDQQNPLVEQTVSIALRSNREVLESSNISLVSSNVPNTVDVVIRGRKQRLNKVSSNDFQAFLDFSPIQDTKTTEIPIPLPEYIGDQDILVLDVYPKVVKLKLENVIRKEFPVSVKWVGELPEGYDAVNVKTNPNTIILEDLESVMNSIGSVAVTLDRQHLLEGNSINRRVEVYNESGKTISMPGANVQVNVAYTLSKTVKVATTVTGKPRDDYYVRDFTLSQDNVRIIGDYDIIKDISEVRAEQLDVSNLNASFQKDLQVQLPENVQLYKTGGVITAQVNIQQFSHQMISIPKASVTIFGGDVTGRMQYRILEDEIAFSVKGPGEILDTLDKKAIRGFVDVSGLGEGTGTVEIEVSLPSGVSLDDNVSVTVEAENVVLSITPGPTPEPGEPTPDTAPGSGNYYNP